MIQKTDIPDFAICHRCGEPMKVIDLTAKAKKLGFHVVEGSFSIECCDFQLSIDDDDEADCLKNMLLAYHNQHHLLNGGNKKGTGRN
ncbi:hypothetical protein [uncultured Gimesia sp.]|uniref:hypothetical protein n=1 Tax=uncultured Gimesia sp. TaxID=1678688 RepID=UPI0030D73C75|tara:strand:- start:439 stop:699 length:261 start_codon:yes stop_codon:yes gene_type:complete